MGRSRRDEGRGRGVWGEGEGGRGVHGTEGREEGKNRENAKGRKGGSWRSKGKRIDRRYDGGRDRTTPQRPEAAYHAKTRTDTQVSREGEGKDAADGALRALAGAEHPAPINEPHEEGRRARASASHDRGGANTKTGVGPRAAHDYPSVDEYGEDTVSARARGATTTRVTGDADGAGSSTYSSRRGPSRGSNTGRPRTADDGPVVDAREGRRINPLDERTTAIRAEDGTAGDREGVSINRYTASPKGNAGVRSGNSNNHDASSSSSPAGGVPAADDHWGKGKYKGSKSRPPVR